jgi:WD40 repeat protein
VPAFGLAFVIVVATTMTLGALVDRRHPVMPSPSAGPSTAPPASPAAACASATADPAATIRPTPDGIVLGCTRDGTRLLIQKDRENLFVLHPDGSETQVTEQLSGFAEIPGSARPVGATISPDGSRVVFAGLTKGWEEGKSCHDGALFAVDADGGPAELLWKSHVPQNGIVRNPTFSPDGTRIAFADGYCDSDHSVWVMNADGSDPHQIVSSDVGPLGGGHVYGLAWSPDGDRIALLFEGATYTFRPDGSDFALGGDASGFCWPGRRC